MTACWSTSVIQQAHEDDPQRAVLAGLAILDATSALNDRIANKGYPRLSTRIGIHSGSVVVDQSNGKEANVFGDVPNIASRVQTAAAPDTVLITAAVHHLVSGLFVVEDRGAEPLKGIEHPIQLYRAIQPSGVRGRLAAASLRGLTPFIGREDELRLLLSRWDRAREGEGQVMLVVGEAGIGKSRLVQRLHEQIADTPHTWVECAAASLHQNSPFYTIEDMLTARRFAGVASRTPTNVSPGSKPRSSWRRQSQRGGAADRAADEFAGSGQVSAAADAAGSAAQTAVWRQLWPGRSGQREFSRW